MRGSFRFGVFLLVAVCLGVNAQPQVSFITPRYGGLNGGTKVSLFGSNFDTSFDLNGDDGSKEVLFLSEDGTRTVICDIHVAESDENQIVCYTRAMNAGAYTLKLKQHGEYLSSDSYCSQEYQCTFNAIEWHTPYVQTLNAVVMPPEQVITLSGRLFTDLTNSTQATASNERTASLRRILSTSGQACNLVDSSTSEPYGVSLIFRETYWSNWGSVSCKLEGSYIGYQNLSLIVNENFGRSTALTSSLSVGADNSLYMIQTYAGVTGVSPMAGSERGGTLLTITGRGFYSNTQAPAQVWVGGEECDNLEVVSDTQMTCTTREQPQSSSFKGGRGVELQIFRGQSDVSADLDSITQNVDSLILDSTAVNELVYSDSGEGAVSRMRGIFIPSVTSNHQFFFDADSDVRFSINKNGNDPSGTLTHLSFPTASSVTRQWTGYYALEAGQEYYFEVRHVEDGGTAQINVGIYVEKTDFSAYQTSQAVTERQDIAISSNVNKEVQTVTFANWADEQEESSIWDVTITCNIADCSGATFVLTLFEVSTSEIRYGEEPIKVKDALNSLLPLSLSGDTVDVGQTGSTYRVTFNSRRGQMEFSGAPGSNSAGALTVSAAVVTQGKPRLDTFTFQVNGRVSNSLSVGASTSDVANAVKSFFGTTCPSQLERSLGFAGTYYDMEDGLIPSGERSAEESFCGIYSVKNPTNLYYNLLDKYSLTFYPHVCFAYKGDISDSLYVRFASHENGAPRDEITVTLSSVGLSDSTDWTHFCFNLNDELATRYPSYTNFEIVQVAVTAGSSSEQDLYLDNIFLGSSNYLSVAEREEYLQRLVPSAVPSIKLESVEVTQTGSTYTVTFSPIDCGHNFPLLGFAFESSLVTTSNDQHEYAFGENQAQATIQRTMSASPPVGGSFALTFEDTTFSSVSAQATAEVLKNELETLDQTKDVEVERSGTCAGYTWSVRFVSPGGRYSLMTADGSGLTASPDAATITAEMINQGGLRMNPAHADFFRTVHTKPQVQVKIDQFLSKCEAETSCDFEWTEAATPKITNISPSSLVQSGTSITITGTGFSTTTSDATVLIGGAACVVQSSTATQIVCTVGQSPSGNQDVSVNVRGKGLAEIDQSFQQIGIKGSVTAISPTSGSSQGGTTVTITGTGFESSSTISIGNSNCQVSSISYTSIACETTSSTNGAVSVSVSTRGATETLSAAQYTYQAPSAAITSISQGSGLSVAGGQSLTITGTGFGSTQGAVRFGDTDVTITSWTDTSIAIESPSLASDSYAVNVKVSDGFAASTTVATYEFSFSDFTPKQGSLVGGTLVTITGSGFSALADKTTNLAVTFCGNVQCEQFSVVDDNTLTCRTTSSGATYSVTNRGDHPSLGLGYQWLPTTLNVNAGDSVTFSWSFPRFVTTAIGLQTVVNSSSNAYDGLGFQVDPSSSGSFTYAFNKPNSVSYINSGCLDSNCDIVMRMRVKVSDPVDRENCQAALRYNAIPAVSQVASNSFSFLASQTSVVSNVSPNEGAIATEFVITGNDFVSPSVTVGGKTCTITESTSTSIKCQVGSDQELAAYQRHDVLVYFSTGLARNEGYTRTFDLFPSVTSVSPTSGSNEGGTLLTIQGAGFTDQSVVSIGGQNFCERQSVTYTEITCKTTAGFSDRSNLDVQVTTASFSPVGCSTCKYSFLSASTPTVSTLTAGGSVNALQLTIAGTRFGTVPGDVSILLSSSTASITTSCDASSATDTEVVCTVSGRYPVGSHTFSVHVSGEGFASIADTVSLDANPAEVDSVSPLSGSTQGGTMLTIQGNGFVDGSTTVTVGGEPCTEMTVSSFSSVTCKTPAGAAGNADVAISSNGIDYPVQTFTYSTASTPNVGSVSPTEGNSGDSVTLTGSGFGTNTGSVSVSIGGVGCSVTAVTDTSITCTLGVRQGGNAAISVSVNNFGLATSSVDFKYSLSVTSVTPVEGSYGGGQTVTVVGHGLSENTIVNVCGSQCVIMTNSPTQITCSTPANENLSSGTTACDVTVANGDDTETRSGAYSYQAALTPTISSVSPDRGGTGGGTVVTITGSGFSTVMSENVVTIDGSTCVVSSASATQIVCATNSHQGALRTKVNVAVRTNGIAPTASADFFYIDRWSSVFTWGGTTLPEDGDFIIIQKGQTVLLDTDTALLKMLLIDGGEFIFDQKDVTLRAENILIVNGGLFQVGTEAEPFLHNAVIEMHGHLRSPELPVYGAKTLGVREGTLDLHGKPIDNPWTLLASTAAAGATQITVQHSASDWQAGDSIVIATTGMRHSQSENEERVIASVSVDGKTLTLTEALDYEHLGVTENIGGRNIEFRAEVGLLSRNIVFRGSNDRTWQDNIPKCEEGFNTGEFATQTCFQGRFGEEVGTDEFGGSIMMHSPTPSSPNITARIENVELTYVGQAFRLGRYPVHWHLMGNVSGMYVRKCAIHKTFNRAVTIHGTHNLLVEHNVVYDVMGGAIFIEDGIETKNVIQYNLAVFVRQSTSLLNDDITPAAYWVTNPDNILRHNHAAGGTHFGIWYRMHDHPDGPSFTSSVCPRKVELGEFKNNTVHSQGWFGIWIFQTYTPVQGGDCNSNIPSVAKFESLTAWRCEKGAEWVNGGALQFNDFVMVDNEHSGIDLKLIFGTSWGVENGAAIRDGLIVGHSSQVDSNYESGRGIILPFAPGLTVSNTKMVNFNRGGAAIGVTKIDGTCVAFCGGFYSRYNGMSFENVNKRVIWRWLHEAALLDEDGTLTGMAAGSTLVPHSGIMDPSECPIQNGDLYSSSSQFPSAICNPGIKFHRIAVNNPLPSSLEANTLHFQNEHGNTTTEYLKKRLTHASGWMGMLQGQKTYRMYWQDGEQFTNLTYNARLYDFSDGDKIIIEHRLLQEPDVVAINDEFRYAVANATALSSSSRNLDWYYDTASQLLQIQVSRDVSNRKRRAAGFPIEVIDPDLTHVNIAPSIYRCFFPGCLGPVDAESIPPTFEKPESHHLWSAADNPCIERDEAADTIVIRRHPVGNTAETCWVVVDVTEITTTNLTVFGVLHFDGNDVTVKARYVVALGGRIYARTDGLSYYNHQLTFELQGRHETAGWAFTGVDLGSKALGCFGGCDLFGKPTTVTWTRLASTASAGANTITLQDSVDWEVGNEIVITTTGYRAIETEKRAIQSISSDGTTLTLTEALTHRHLGESYTVGGKTFDMRAEVGLLTRNIKIIGESYDDIDTEAFGARVLVGNLPARTVDGTEVSLTGWGRFSNVEFLRTGQEGWTERWDPRFSLAWLNTGTPSEARPSYVAGCAFHDGYSTAIGIFGADQLEITKNVVHRTIHDGIRVTGRGHKVENNLVTVTLFRGSYGDRFELTNYKDWQASFELSEASDLVLNGNVAAGSERLGFHLDGEACDAADDTAYTGNVAHGVLHGVHIFTEDGIIPCTMVRNFVIYKAWDYGVYHQTSMSVLVKDTIIVDANIGYMPLIYGPPALSHECVEKTASAENLICVGRSDSFDSSVDFMDERNDKNLRVRSAGPDRAAPRNPFGGSTCVMLPYFESETNSAPFKGFHFTISYPSICGLLNISGLHAHNYRLNSDNKRDLVFSMNPKQEDAFHPTILKGVTLTNVEDASKVFFGRPSLGKINPADCVDMECDGKKKALIKDLDGSFLGDVGAVVPQAEFAWDDPNHPARGLGDFRIPKTMLSRPDGSRIPIDTIVSHRGIIRNEECTYKSSWQAYSCQGAGAHDYQMLVIESMDDDTETRRLTPLALLGDGYIDLTNGPQDHGWCSGYTCQKRISTFYTLVATGTHFDVYFTGYGPKHLRLRLLNVDDTKTVRVAIWYARPERLDIYRTNDQQSLYIHPENSQYSESQQEWVWDPLTPANVESYKPAVDSPKHGANLLDVQTQLLYLTLRGSDPIDIETSPAIFVKLGFPAISVDEFFGENLINNLANFLGVPSSKIRMVNVVRETSSRKRRDTSSETVTYTIMYVDQLENTTTHDSATQDSAIEVLNNNVEALIIAYQSNTLSEILGVNASSFETAPISVNVSGEVNENYLVTYNIPRTLSATWNSQAEEYLVFAEQPTLTLLDEDNNPVATLDNIFRVRATLDKTVTGADQSAMLLGTTEIMFMNGTAQFTDLAISHSGTYNLQFEIINPAGVSLTTTINSVIVARRTVNVGFVGGVTSQVLHNQPITIVAELQNANNQPLDNVGYKGHNWRADVTLDDAASYAPVTFTSGTTITYSFDPGTARLTTDDLSLVNTENFHRYNLRFRIYTEPALYDFTVVTDSILFSDSNFTSLTVSKRTKFVLDGTPYLSRNFEISPEKTFETNTHNNFVKRLDTTNQRITDYSHTASGGNTEITFTLNGANEEAATSGISDLENFVRNGGVQYNGAALSFTTSSGCSVTIDNTCQDPTQAVSIVEVPSGSAQTETWVYVVIGVVCATVLGAGLILFACLMKRAKSNKIGSGHHGKGCLDAESSRGSTPFVDSFYTGSTDFATPGADSQMGQYSELHHRTNGMTPVQN